jgi:hypothetical protein
MIGLILIGDMPRKGRTKTNKELNVKPCHSSLRKRKVY